MHTIEKVKIFHQIFNHPISEKPGPGSQLLRQLRVQLIAEEFCELCEALGVGLVLRTSPFGSDISDLESYKQDSEVDIVEAADGLGDLDYVVQGANLVFGFPSEEILNEIQRANMSKLGEDGKPIYRDDGKVLKGPNYQPPDIASIIFRVLNIQAKPSRSFPGLMTCNNCEEDFNPANFVEIYKHENCSKVSNNK